MWRGSGILGRGFGVCAEGREREEMAAERGFCGLYGRFWLGGGSGRMVCEMVENSAGGSVGGSPVVRNSADMVCGTLSQSYESTLAGGMQ